MLIRVRFKCIKKEKVRGGYDLAFQTVTNESPENKEFFLYTPAGQITMYAVKPEVADTLETDMECFFDISPTPIQ